LIFLQILGVQRIFSLKGLPLALLIHLACLALLKIIAPFLVKPLEDIPEDLRFLEHQEVEAVADPPHDLLGLDREVMAVELFRENPRWSFISGQHPLYRI
jgi:hypothetical protein